MCEVKAAFVASLLVWIRVIYRLSKMIQYFAQKGYKGDWTEMHNHWNNPFHSRWKLPSKPCNLHNPVKAATKTAKHHLSKFLKRKLLRALKSFAKNFNSVQGIKLGRWKQGDHERLSIFKSTTLLTDQTYISKTQRDIQSKKVKTKQQIEINRTARLQIWIWFYFIYKFFGTFSRFE